MSKKDYKIMEYYNVNGFCLVAVCKSLEYVGLLVNGNLQHGDSTDSLLHKLCLIAGTDVSKQEFESFFHLPETIEQTESLLTYRKIVKESES
tara:strand:- start:1190 stop:1465 length:276 start_codon:yes stop_codon:yes gene_type:complete